MPHPFEVGKTYRNRVGEYVVLSLDDDQMKIRYVNGGTLTTSAIMQARIWENIQFEEQVSRSEERRRLALEARLAARTRTKRAKERPSFGGFQESDLAKKRGVAWRSRKELGRVLCYELNRAAKQAFDYWLVPRQASIHVALKSHYDAQTPHRSPAFFVAVSDQGVYFGFHVGRPEGAEEPTWPWSTLVEALATHEGLREGLKKTMEEYKLTLDLHAMRVSFGLVGQIILQGPEYLWQYEDAQQGITRPMNGEDLVETLRTLEPGRRCELYLNKCAAPEAAVKAGGAISQEIVAVFEALLPVYRASLGT